MKGLVMNARSRARVACAVPWCTEQPERHAEMHMRVLFSHVGPGAGSTSGAVQLAAFARDDDPQLALILVNRDLLATPERVAITPSWLQVDEIAHALVDRRRMVWDVGRADAHGQPASLEVKPTRYGEALDVTAAQYGPVRALTALAGRALAHRLSDALLAARYEFRALAA